MPINSTGFDLDAAAAWLRTLGLEPELVVAAAAMLIVTLLVLAVLASRRRSRAGDMALAEIKGRLAAIADVTAQTQGEAARSLTDRLDTLSRHVPPELDTVAVRVGGDETEAGRPPTETLATLNERLAVISEARQSLADLSSEVGALTGVLANPQARGAFGQLRMENIVRDSLPAGSYERQATLSNSSRPDCLIRLPNTPAPLVVDSKFPLEGFEALRAARGAEDVKAATASVRQAVGRHIDDIAEKYLIPGETQDTALMFVAAESIYATLHEAFPDLIQKAYRSRVVIVAPNIFMLAVQTMQAVIKDVQMRDQAGLIQREVGHLLEDVARLVERVAELERHFALSGKALEKVQASAAKISSRGERLTSLDFEGEPEALAARTRPNRVSGA